MKTDFTIFIEEIRKKKKIRYWEIAERLDLSLSYIHDIFAGNRKPPFKILKDLAEILGLNEKETAKMYDLAGTERHTIAPDLTDYIMAHPALRSVIRKTRDEGFGDDFWEKSLRKLKETKENRRKQDGKRRKKMSKMRM